MKLTDLNRASSIAAIDRIYKSDPDLFAIGAEYDQGYDPQSLQTLMESNQKGLVGMFNL